MSLFKDDMGKVIGIPRALLYYKYYPFWRGFLEELGAKVVVSPKTDKKIIQSGLEYADNDICLSVKIFYGHVLSLRDKVDAIFIPRVVSVERDGYTCPKFMGLPDMIRAMDVDLPPIIDPTINLKLGKRKFFTTLYDLGTKFTKNPKKIFHAYQRAKKEMEIFEKKLKSGLSAQEAIDELSEIASPSARNDKMNIINSPSDAYGKRDLALKIGLAGHPYNLFDTFVTMNLVERLRKHHVQTLFIEEVPQIVAEKEANSLHKKLFWTYEKEVVGAALHWLRSKSVDGIIYIVAFACGPDSLIQVLLEEEARELGQVPLMSLIIDEHDSEAGLMTRLEAFLDMIERKKVYAK